MKKLLADMMTRLIPKTNYEDAVATAADVDDGGGFDVCGGSVGDYDVEIDADKDDDDNDYDDDDEDDDDDDDDEGDNDYISGVKGDEDEVGDSQMYSLTYQSTSEFHNQIL